MCVCLSCFLEAGVDIEVGHVRPCQEEQIHSPKLRLLFAHASKLLRMRPCIPDKEHGRSCSDRQALLVPCPSCWTGERFFFFYRKFSLLRLSRFYSWGLVQYGGRRMEILMTVRKIASICTMVGIYFSPEFPPVAVSLAWTVCARARAPARAAGVLVQHTGR